MGNKRLKKKTTKKVRGFRATEEFPEMLVQEFAAKFPEFDEDKTCEEIREMISDYLEERDNRGNENKIPPLLFTIDDEKMICCRRSCKHPEIKLSGFPKLDKIRRHRAKHGGNGQLLSQNQIILFWLEGRRLQISSYGKSSKQAFERLQAKKGDRIKKPLVQQNSMNVSLAVNFTRDDPDESTSMGSMNNGTTAVVKDPSAQSALNVLSKPSSLFDAATSSENQLSSPVVSFSDDATLRSTGAKNSSVYREEANSGNSSNADRSSEDHVIDNGISSRRSSLPDNTDFSIPAVTITQNEFEGIWSNNPQNDIPGPFATSYDPDVEEGGDYADDVHNFDTHFDMQLAGVNNRPERFEQEKQMDVSVEEQVQEEPSLTFSSNPQNDIPGPSATFYDPDVEEGGDYGDDVHGFDTDSDTQLAEVNNRSEQFEQENHMDVPVEDQVQEEPSLIEEDYWEVPTLISNGVSLRIPKSQKHCLEVVRSIFNKVFEQAFKKLSGGPKRFGLEEKFDPETVHVVFEDIKNEIQRFHKRFPGQPLVESDQWKSETCDMEVAAAIVKYSYAMAIPKPRLLNCNKQGVQTYGETNLKQIQKIFEEIKLKKSDVFVDLGSGVGQLVNYAAALNIRYAAGIENAKNPVKAAVAQGEMFQRLMLFFGKKGGPFKLHDKCFLSENFRKLILEKATIIFMNNFSFGPLTLKVYEKWLQHAKDGTKVVLIEKNDERRSNSNKAAILSNFTTKCKTENLKEMVEGVSWTAKAVPFYCLTVDNQKLIEKSEELEQRTKELGDAQKLKQEKARLKKERGITLNGGEEPVGNKQQKRKRQTDSDKGKKKKRE